MTQAEFYHKHTKITRSLKKFIADQHSRVSAEIFEAFLSTLSEELQRIYAVITESPAGPARAAKIHELVDAEIAGETSIPVSCKKGCNHCCHLEVQVTNHEAEVLRALIAEGFPVNHERLMDQSVRPVQAPEWRDLRFKLEHRCVFLNAEGSCGVYQSRPVMCRRHSVTSPPENCATLDQAITLRYFPRVDLIISAANEDPTVQVGPLAKMLLVEGPASKLWQ